MDTAPPLTFRYFEGPQSEMPALIEGPRRCDLCGADGLCFDLAEAAQLEDGPDARHGCARCLRDGRFGFTKSTELGLIDADGLHRDPPREPARRVFVASAEGLAVETGTRPTAASSPSGPGDAEVEELFRTPDFSSWNEVPWPVHCDDFMVYVGPWEPADAVRVARERGVEPQELLRSMMEPRMAQLVPADADQWTVHLPVFRCSACSELRGWPDWS